MNGTDENTKLHAKLTSLEQLLEKLTKRLDDQKKHHQSELAQARSLIDLQQTTNTQAKASYELALLDLEATKKLSAEYHQKTNDRKKAITEIQHKIDELKKHKKGELGTKHRRGASLVEANLHDSKSNLVPFSSVRIKARSPTPTKVDGISRSDPKSPPPRRTSYEPPKSENKKETKTVDLVPNPFAPSGSSHDSVGSSRFPLNPFAPGGQPNLPNERQELIIENQRVRKKSYTWSKSEMREFVKQLVTDDGTENHVHQESQVSDASSDQGWMKASPGGEPPKKSIAPPALQPTRLVRKTNSFEDSPVPMSPPGGRVSSKMNPSPSLSSINPFPKSASASERKPSERVSPLRPTASATSIAEKKNEEAGPPVMRRRNSISAGDSETGQRIKLSITCGKLTVTTIAYSDWTIGTLIGKVSKKFPNTARGFALHYKLNNTKLKLLDNDKKIASYKQLLDPHPPDLLFQERVAKKPSTLSRLWSKSTRANIEQIHDAIKREDLAHIKRLLDAFSTRELEELNQWGQTPLHAAINSNNVAIVDIFLNYYKKMNMDINIPDNFGWTVLHFAVSSTTGNASDDEILDHLLKFPGIEVDVSNNDSNTPLHYFCQRFSSPSCQRLGETLINKAPACVNRKNKNGETPLHKAIFNPTIRVLMVKLLVNNGADVNIPNSKAGETALHYAVRLGRKDLIKILLIAGADLNIKDSVKKFTPYELAVDTTQEDVKNILRAILDLKDWLKEIQLEDYFSSFLREEIFLDVITLTDEDTLGEVLDRLQIKDDSARARIASASKSLKGRMSKKEFEARLINASKKKRLSIGQELAESRIGEFKETLHRLVEGAGEYGEDRWLISHETLEFTKELGSGRSGMVFKGLYKGQKTAIKVMAAHAAESTLDEFRKEFHVMSSVRSPNIVHFYGACLEPRLCIVMEYCSRGSLHSVLNDTGIQIGWERALDFAQDMTASLKFLHTFDPPIFHRDMKSLNLLVTEEWKVKICDFGLARFNTGDQLATMTKLCGTFSYASPELYSGLPYTDKCDVFSTAIVFWELVTRVISGSYKQPYKDQTNLKQEYQILYHVAKKNLRPTLLAGTPPRFAKLITRCWDPVGVNRPSTTQILEELKEIKEEMFPEQKDSN